MKKISDRAYELYPERVAALYTDGPAPGNLRKRELVAVEDLMKALDEFQEASIPGYTLRGCLP